MSMFIKNFNDKEDVLNDYKAPAGALKGAKIYLAWYGYGFYCGESLVIFEQGGKLFEVNGSHCSCNGLEGQWEPEDTTWEALQMRNLSGECEGSGEANIALHKLVDRHLSKSKRKRMIQ